jgi:hypothetical protein
MIGKENEKKVRKVRNFWIELEIDGRKTRIATGPEARDGGFHLTVFMRDHGETKEALIVNGAVTGGYSLDLHAELKLVKSPNRKRSLFTYTFR